MTAMRDTLPALLPTDFTLDERLLSLVIGSVAAREFVAGTDHGRVDAWRDMSRIAAAEDERTWLMEVAGAITDSARMQSFRGNWEALHAVASFAYEDGKRRDALAGRSSRCDRHSIYSRAHRQAMREQGHRSDTPECRCEVTP